MNNYILSLGYQVLEFASLVLLYYQYTLQITYYYEEWYLVQGYRSYLFDGLESPISPFSLASEESPLTFFTYMNIFYNKFVYKNNTHIRRCRRDTLQGMLHADILNAAQVNLFFLNKNI